MVKNVLKTDFQLERERKGLGGGAGSRIVLVYSELFMNRLRTTESGIILSCIIPLASKGVPLFSTENINNVSGWKNQGSIRSQWKYLFYLDSADIKIGNAMSELLQVNAFNGF